MRDMVMELDRRLSCGRRNLRPGADPLRPHQNVPGRVMVTLVVTAMS